MVSNQKMRWTGSRQVSWDHSLPLGDSIFGSLVPAIMGSIAATLAVAGNPAGIFFGSLWQLFMTFSVGISWNLPIKKGLTSSTTCKVPWQLWSTQLPVLGIFMVGAWLPAWLVLKFLGPTHWGQSDWNSRYAQPYLPNVWYQQSSQV